MSKGIHRESLETNKAKLHERKNENGRTTMRKG